MKNQFRIEKRERQVIVKMANGDQAEKTQFIAICWKDTPKGRFSKEKQVWGYHFKSAESREEYIHKFFDSKLKDEQAKEARIQAKKDARVNMVNPFKVGDILYDSWGYDQTNIDFYQVIETGPKHIKMREVGQEMIEPAGDMSEYVGAKKDSFTGEAIHKNLQVLANGRIYVKSRHGWISKWDGQKKYQSHYA